MNNQNWLLRYVLSIVKNEQVAEDIVQEVFISAYRNYDGYEERGKIRQWLRTIARNTSIRYIQGTSRWDTVSLHSDLSAVEGTLCLADTLTSSDGLEGDIVNKELLQRVLVAISELPNEQKQVVYYRYIENLSINMVADLTCQPLGSVKSKSYYGMAKVKKKIANYLVEGEYVMSCRESYPFYYQYAKGKITSEDRMKVERHIAVCEECKQIVSSLEKLVPHLKPAQEGESRHWIISIPLKNETLDYFGMDVPMHEHFERANEVLSETGGRIPEGETWFGAGHDANLSHIGEFDNEGNRIEYEIISNPHNANFVRVVYKRMKKVFPLHAMSSAILSNQKCIKSMIEDPRLMIGELQNSLGNNAKSGLYLALPGKADNIRIKQGNGVIDCGYYKFAFSERYVTEDEIIRLKCSFLKGKCTGRTKSWL